MARFQSGDRVFNTTQRRYYKVLDMIGRDYIAVTDEEYNFDTCFFNLDGLFVLAGEEPPHPIQDAIDMFNELGERFANGDGTTYDSALAAVIEAVMER